MLAVGDRAYPVDLSNNPQEQRAGSAMSGNVPRQAVGQEDDPLLRKMEELRNTASSVGSVRRSQQGMPEQQQQQQGRPGHQPKDSTSQLSPPPGGRGGGPPNKMDYRRSAEIVVGGPPPGAASRPSSPNPPTAVMAMAPSVQPDQTVQNVVQDYQQSFPGERKSVSRPGSRAGSFSGPNPMQGQQNRGRPMSSDSMAGVGAQGRSPSPQPFRPPSRAASPMQQPGQRGVSPAMQRNVSPAVQTSQLPPQNMRQNSVRAPGAVATPLAHLNGHTSRQSSISQQSQRPVSPNPVGIALDPSGRVVADVLADQYNNARGYPQQAPPPAPMQQPPQQYHPTSRQGSYPAPVQQPPYGAPPPSAAPMYQQNPYLPQQVPPPQQAIPPPPQVSPQYAPQQQYQQRYDPQRTQSINSVGVPTQQGQYYAGQMQQQQQQYPPQAYGTREPPRAPSPMQQQETSPTGAYTDDGRPILFYGESCCVSSERMIVC